MVKPEVLSFADLYSLTPRGEKILARALDGDETPLRLTQANLSRLREHAQLLGKTFLAVGVVPRTLLRIVMSNPNGSFSATDIPLDGLEPNQAIYRLYLESLHTLND